MRSLANCVAAIWFFGVLASGVISATAAAPIRLEHKLSEAKISSPLLRVQAVNSLKALRRVPSHSVLKRDFETETETDAEPGETGCSVSTQSGQRALHYRGGAPTGCVFLIAVDPATHYSISRRVRTDEPLVDLAVMESRIELDHPESSNHSSDLENLLNPKREFPARGTLIYTHHFERPDPNRWGTDSLHIFTTPHTRTLVMMVLDPEGMATSKPRNARFDDLEVDRLEPRPRQELALLKGLDLAPGSDPALGIAKHAQLLPVSGVVEPPYDVNYEFRHALFAPAPTSIRYALLIPTDARLRFSYAMFKASRPGDAVRFRVAVAHGGSETELFRRSVVVRASGQGWHWREATVDLSAFAGQQVELRLETTALPRTRGYALWGTPTIDTPRTAEDPPNVLLIGVDTLRADRLSSYGYTRDTSTHIDALAADGVRFERALSGSNWTAPSFASLMTGLTPSQHLVIHRSSAIAPSVATLAEYFRDAGWLTRGIAYKAYLYNMGFEQGFDTWLGIPAIESTADTLVAKAREWLRSNGDRRFFLFLHLNDPHQPFNQPPKFKNRYGDSGALDELGLTLPFVTTLSGQVASCSKCTRDGKSVPTFRTVVSDLYDGEVAYLDDRIGILVDTLKRQGHYDDTIIAFVSDHGESLFDRGEFYGHGQQNLFDELIRVPLIIKPELMANNGVDHWARGRVVQQQVRSFDLMPTLLDLAGIDFDASAIAAATLRPALEAVGSSERDSGSAKDDSMTINERVGISENLLRSAIAVSWRGWKYVLKYAPGEPVGQALYRFAVDPGERENVIDRHPAVAGRLRALILDYFLQHRPGHYLMLTGSQREVNLRVGILGVVRSARSLFGPALVESEPGVFMITGSAPDGLVFAHFDADTDLNFEITATGEDETSTGGAQRLETESYRPGLAIEMLSDDGRALRAFRTLAPAQASALATDKRAEDATRREALEALGYVE